MVLSNAERQARYRERLKQLAARGVLSSAQAQLLTDARRQVREWRRSISSFAGGRIWIKVGNVDQSSEHITRLNALIANNDKLVAEFDPDDVTADGNVEIGEVSVQEFAEIYAGRWLSYSLDERERAVNIRGFEGEGMARVDARQPGRSYGIVGADNWSIEPAPRRNAYALIQEMPNGWWKALISGWGDLPEQYGRGADAVISEIGAVAREYLRQKVERGIATVESHPAELPGWQCVPVSIDL